MSAEDQLPRELTSSVARRGKWTAEEERYTEKIIFDFEHGTLDVPEGTTLRTLLSKVLNCDPMRITKKYTGNSSIGKRTFVPLVRTPENAIFMDMSQQDLRELRAVWVNKLILMEQWNNRKMNLMKAHMGIGSMYDPAVSGGASSGLFGGMTPSNSMFNPAYAAHLSHLNSQASQQSSQQGSQQSSGQSSLQGTSQSARPATQPHRASLEDKLSSASSETGTTQQTEGTVKEEFQEVALRMMLEPFVATTAEMDYIIKWLKTLFFVLVDRTLSAADLEHSLYVGSISLPALVAIHRSRCICNNARLRQVHNTVVAYLKQIGIIFPGQESMSSQSSSSALLPTSSVTAPTSAASISGVTTIATGAASAPLFPAPAARLSVERELLRPSSFESMGSVSTDGSTNAPTKESKRNDPSPSASIDLLADAAASSGDAGKRKRSVTDAEQGSQAKHSTSNSPTRSPERAVAEMPPPSPPKQSLSGSDVLLPPPAVLSVPNMSSLGFSMIPAHLRAMFTGASALMEDSADTDSPYSGPGAGAEGVSDVNGIALGFKASTLPYRVDPQTFARYQAELQAAAFSEQLSRAKAQAEAQAQALADSYHSGRSGHSHGHSHGHSSHGNSHSSEAGSSLTVSSRAASNPNHSVLLRGPLEAAASNSSDGSADHKMPGMDTDEQERVADADDHLMQYHKALVQSLAAERALKKTAAAAARNVAAARGLPRPYQQSASHGYSQHTQPGLKRRKITEFNESYMRAAYNTQQAQPGMQGQAGQPYQSPPPAQADQYQPGPESSNDSRIENRRVEEEDRVTPLPNPLPQSSYNPRMGEGYHYNHAPDSESTAGIASQGSANTDQDGTMGDPAATGDTNTNAAVPAGVGTSATSASSSGSVGSSTINSAVHTAADYDRAAQSMAAMSMLYENNYMKGAPRRRGMPGAYPPTIPTLPSVASQMTPEIFSQFLHSYYAWPFGTPPIHMMPPPGEQSAQALAPQPQAQSQPGQGAYVQAPAQAQSQSQSRGPRDNESRAPSEWPAQPSPARASATTSGPASVVSVPSFAAGRGSEADAGSVHSVDTKLTLEDCLKLMQRQGPATLYPGMLPELPTAQGQRFFPMPSGYRMDPAYGAYGKYPYGPPAHGAAPMLAYPPYPGMYPVPGIPAALLSSNGSVGNGSVGAPETAKYYVPDSAIATAEVRRDEAAASEEAKREKAEQETKEQGHSAAAEALLNLFNK